METKNHNQINTKKTILRKSDRGQQKKLFFQAQSLFMHFWSNIVGDLDSKQN